MALSAHVTRFVLNHCHAEVIHRSSCVQRLWSDYGQIVRLELSGDSAGGADGSSVILKQVQPPAVARHPRGWNGRAGEQRKRDSYRVEACWYERYAAHTPLACRVPEPIAVEQGDAGVMILMEDLDRQYPLRHKQLSLSQANACLDWLAAFHAHYLANTSDGLWPIGTYWHLDTRTDEYAAMESGRVKHAARWLDGQLRNARFQTLVHGDAKLANFCFASSETGLHGNGPGNNRDHSTDHSTGNNGSGDAHSSRADSTTASVAMVDFQYVGRGPGVCDVAYFLGSCLDEVRLEQAAGDLLDHYFVRLRHWLATGSSRVDANALEAEWRSLYPVAWVDFYRFLLGWAPDHGKINAYTRRLADELLGA